MNLGDFDRMREAVLDAVPAVRWIEWRVMSDSAIGKLRLHWWAWLLPWVPGASIERAHRAINQEIPGARVLLEGGGTW